MYPAEFDYYRPRSVAEATALLRKHKDSRVLAGGHSLLPAMKFRLATPRVLVDIGGIGALAGIRARGKALEIGALATHTAVASSDLVSRTCPILAETAAVAETLWVTRRPPVFRDDPPPAFGRGYPHVPEELGRAAVAMVEQRVRAGLPPRRVAPM